MRPGPTIALRLLMILMVAVATSPTLAQEAKPHPKLREVIIVYKTHFDIGYTAMAADVVELYRTRLMDRALSTFDGTAQLRPEQRFVWTVPGWPLTQILGPEQGPERRQRIEDLIGEHRFFWHALPFTTHTDSLELEDLVRGMGFSSRLARQFDQPLPRDAKMTDVPSHACALPTILARAGVEFLHLGCNAASTPPDLPTLFWWEGPDGSRVLTMQSLTYGTTLLPPDDWPYATWLALLHSGDNRGAPPVKDITAALKQAAKELPGVRVRTGRLSDFADAIRREDPPIPVVRADMPDTWIHGIMSSPIESGVARRVRPQIAALEALNTLAGAWGLKTPSAREAVAAAYEQSLLYGEHTWGMNTKSFGERLYGDAWLTAWKSGRYRQLEASWDEHGSYIRKAEKLVTPAVRENLDALAAGIAVSGQRIVVFNPLPWSRDDLVSIQTDKVPPALRDLDTGRQIPVQQTEGGIRFLAKDVPAMGYRTYVPSATAVTGPAVNAENDSAILENEFFRVRLDTDRGGISSSLDKRSGRELVDVGSPYCVGQYLYECYDADEVAAFQEAYNIRKKNANDFGKPNLPPASQAPHTVASPHGYELKVLHGPVASTATLRSTASADVPHAVTLKITLPAASPFIEFEWAIEAKQPTPWPEAGWLCFPLAVEQPAFRLGRLGGIVDPAKDIQRSANHLLYCLNSGLTLKASDGAGVGLCPLDSPLASLERRGLWQFSHDFVPTRPLVYVNLYNNQWSTNFRQWIGGSWSSRVRLWAVNGTTASTGRISGAHAADACGLVRPSWEARVPCLAAASEGPAGSLPPTQAGLTLSRGGVLVTAFGPNPDGEGLLLRLWEQAGSDESCRVKLPGGLRPKTAHPCDLRGRSTGQPIPVKNGEFEVAVPHDAPVSLLLQE